MTIEEALEIAEEYRKDEDRPEESVRIGNACLTLADDVMRLQGEIERLKGENI